MHNAYWILTRGGGGYLPKYPTVRSTHWIHGEGTRAFIGHQNQPNVGKYIIHGPYGV